MAKFPQKGERRGGRKKGTPNKATVEKRRIAEQALEVARAMGIRTVKEGERPLAKDLIGEAMMKFYQLAIQYEAKIEGGKSGGKMLREYVHYLKLSVDCAKALAPYESPTLSSVKMGGDGSEMPVQVVITEADARV